ncbi:MAG: 3-phosphoshikimate 1-carboxyvinyltransferase [Clostridioides sp.]|nr:3-phosphoshikimate 1-carboxyvinyltransferase [Clostridioides sp.]
MDIKIYPSKLNGSITVPPSKSMAHRLIICASLADGISKIRNVELSDDISATIDAMKVAGADIEIDGNTVKVKGRANKDVSELREKPDIKEIPRKTSDINLVDCNESGSTLRFLIPVFSALELKARFIGEGRLHTRPLKPYYDIFDSQKITYSYDEEKMDLRVEGNLSPGKIYIRGDISSQFISGLLFSLPLLDGDSEIEITTKLESRSYVDMTIEALKRFGVDIDIDYPKIFIKGNQRYISTEVKVEGDYSQAAFFMSARALGSDIEVSGLNEDSLQGDKIVAEVFESLITETYNTVDVSQLPDVVPEIAFVASLSSGMTKIVNASRLRLKESDRLAAIYMELGKLGADVQIDEDSLVIRGVNKLRGGVEVWSHDDHRIAMMLAIASAFCEEPVVLKSAESVKKSYPKFYEDFKKLGGIFHEWNLGK